MKNILLVLLLVTSYSGFAQHTTSRETVNGVQDASVTSYATRTIADTPGATTDTIEIRPNAKFQAYNVNVVDSSSVRLKSTAGCYKGDVLDLYITNPTITGNFVYLAGNWVVSTGTAKISLTSGKKSYMRFVFDGVKYVETARNLNY